MAITVNGQILRNLPEQVSKNTEDILDLQDTTNLQGDKIAALENSIITDITLNNLEVTGNTFIGNANTDTLVVTGASSFAGNVNVTGNVTASGALAAASASFTSETISGNLTVNGNIVNTLLNNTENILKGAADVPDYYANEGDIEFPSLTQPGFSVPFAHWRVSNGKLNIVILVKMSGVTHNNVALGQIFDNRFSIPQWVLDKLSTISESNLVISTSQVNKLLPIASGGYPTSSVDCDIWLALKKSTGSISANCVIRNITTDAQYDYLLRFEYNFML